MTDTHDLRNQWYDEPVQYEKPMTEIEELKAQIKVLQNKLEELEKRPSPAEEAFKEFYGAYPITDIVDTSWDSDGWVYFEAGYNAAYKEKVVKQKDDYPYKKYTPEETEQSLKKAFREAVKQGVVSSNTTPNSLYDCIANWWDEIFVNGNPSGQNIESLVDSIKEWLPDAVDDAQDDWDDGYNAYYDTVMENLK